MGKLLSQYRKISRGSPSLFQHCSGIETTLRVENNTISSRGLARFPVDSLMSHSTEMFVGETFNVPKKLGYRETLCIMEGITIFH